MFLNFFAYGKFGSHGQFAIYWISRNNRPRCIGSLLYISCRPHGFREKDFFYVSHYKSVGANDHRDVASLDPRSYIGRIYVGDH